MNNQIQLVLKSSTAEMPLNDQALGIYLTPELDGLVGLPEIRTTSGVNAGYDGGWTSAQNYDARSITIRGVIANENVATVERLRKQLVSLAGQGKSEELTLDLVTEAGNAYTLQVRTIALEMSMQSVLTQQQFMLQLRADDPLIYDAGESAHEATLQVAQATGGFTIDFELPLAITGGSEESVVNNDGLEEVPTIVKMYGALHNPEIINQTNNEQMQIMTDLGYAEGAWHTPSEASEGAVISLANTPDSAPFSDIQLKGDTYQNGTPTPSAPVPVKVVTGENAVKINGKNLYDFRNLTYKAPTFTADDDGWLTCTLNTAPSGNSDQAYYTHNLPLKNSTQYAVVLEVKSISGSGQLVVYSRWSGNQEGQFTTEQPINFSNLQAGKTYVYKPTTYASFNYDVGLRTYVRFAAGQTGSITFRLSVLADTSITADTFDYEPYQGQSYTIGLFGSKNIFDKDNANNWNGYMGDASLTAAANARSLYIPVTAGQTYTFTRPNTTSQVNDFGYCFISDVPVNGKAYLDGRHIINSALTFTATAPTGAKYMLIYFAWNPSAETLATILSGYQIEYGSTSSAYEAFQSIELCKIGDYQDYIYKSGGKWYKHKEVGIADLSKDVDTADTYHINGRGYAIRVTSGTPQKTTSGSEIMRGFCDKLTLSSRDAIYATGSQNSISVGDPSTDYWKDFFLDPDGTNGMSASDFNTWLSNNPIKVYYILATPTEIEITNEALIAQLNDLLNLSRTYQGQTNMADLAASGNMPAILNVSYFTEQDPDTRDELIIDSRLHTVTLNGLDIYHLIGEGSEFLMLEPGENRLSLQSDITGDNGYAVVSYKQGYLSI